MDKPNCQHNHIAAEIFMQNRRIVTDVVGAAVVGATVVGAAVVGFNVVGAAVVG